MAFAGCQPYILLLVLLNIELGGCVLSVASVRSGAELAQALADPAVDTIYLEDDVAWSDDDFTGLGLPVGIARNVTVSSAPSRQEPTRWATLNANYVWSKVYIQPGCTLLLTNLVLVGWRMGPHFAAPGIDFIASHNTTPSADAPIWEWPACYIQEAVLWQRTCLPRSLNGSSSRSTPRPSILPGPQRSVVNLPQEGCVNSSTAHPLERCWPMIGRYYDLGMAATEYDAVYGRGVQSGWLWWMQNVTFLCNTQLPEDCVARLGNLGCFSSIFGPGGKGVNGTARTGLDTPAGAGGGGGGGDGDGESTALLAGLLGGLLGGAVLLATVVLAVAVTRRRRRRGCDAAKESAASDSTHDRDVDSAARPASMLTETAGDTAAAAGPDVGRMTATNASSAPPPTISSRSSSHPLPSSGATATSGRNGSAPSSVHPPPTLQQAEALPVRLLTPQRPGVMMDVQGESNELKLLPVVRGKGSFGRVQEGLYKGMRVAVKLLSEGLVPLELVQEEQQGGQPQGGQQQGAHGAEGAQGAAPAPRVSEAHEYLSTSGSLAWGPHRVQRASPGPPSCEQPGQLQAGENGAQQAAQPVDGKEQAREELGRPARAAVVVDVDKLGGFDPAGGGAGAAADAAPAAGRAAEHGLAGLEQCTPTESSGVETPYSVFTLNATTLGGTGTSAGAALAALLNGTRGAGHQAASLQDGPLPALQIEAIAESESADSAIASEPWSVGGPGRKPLAATPGEGGVGGIGAGLGDEGTSKTITTLEATLPAKLSLAVGSLRAEVEVLARCESPYVVKLLAANLGPPRPCLVMELMDTSLAHMMAAAAAAGSYLPLDQVLSIAIDVASGLAYLHPTIIHRDMKPENILVNGPDTERPSAKLSDFGLSRLHDTAVITQRPEAGTVSYLAPELWDAANNLVTYQVDVYAFGVVLWELLAGRRAWAGLRAAEIGFAVAMQSRRPAVEQIPPERRHRKLLQIMADCWERDPARRPAAAELVKRLLLAQQMLAAGHHPGVDQLSGTA